MTEEVKEKKYHRAPPHKMDEAQMRMIELLAVYRFIVKYWDALDNPRKFLSAANEEFANVITPAIAWREFAALNGLDLE